VNSEDPPMTRSGAPATGERRKRPRYLYSATMTMRSHEGRAMPGIRVEISEIGMSAMVSGVLMAGETVELEPVAGGKTTAWVRHQLGRLYGFEFVGLKAEQAARIVENCKNLGRLRCSGRSA
jgi:PilZ domain